MATIVNEISDGHPLPPDAIDGMAWILDDDTKLSTDWDIGIENPPHESYNGPDLMKITE